MFSCKLINLINVLKTEGNLNNHIGLPLTLLKLKDHTAVVVEMGMNHLNEISFLSNNASCVGHNNRPLLGLNISSFFSHILYGNI